jgi:hypothetical protein
MIAFIRGTRIPLITVVMPLSASTVSNATVNLLSRSRISYLTAVAAASWRSMARLRAI